MQSGIGFGLASFSGFGCVTRNTGVCEALSKRGRAYRSDAQASLDTHSAPHFHKSPRLWDLLVLYVAHLKVVLTARQGQAVHVSTNVFRIPQTARKPTAKQRVGWGCGGSVGVAALGTFSTATVSSVETA